MDVFGMNAKQFSKWAADRRLVEALSPELSRMAAIVEFDLHALERNPPDALERSPALHALVVESVDSFVEACIADGVL